MMDDTTHQEKIMAESWACESNISLLYQTIKYKCFETIFKRIGTMHPVQKEAMQWELGKKWKGHLTQSQGEKQRQGNMK